MLQRKAAADILTLSSGADRCDLIPALGGSIASWTVNGQGMMRSASAFSIATNDPFGMASFPLVPYSNRIGDGSFEWSGKRYALARNFPPEPHAIHGVGFEQPWRVAARDADSASLVLHHRPGASWPFAFEAQQRIKLGDGSLAIEMMARNLADRAAPLAFGHHPYFPRGGALLKFRARGVWLVGDDGLPSSAGQTLRQIRLRHRHAGGARRNRPLLRGLGSHGGDHLAGSAVGIADHARPMR